MALPVTIVNIQSKLTKDKTLSGFLFKRLKLTNSNFHGCIFERVIFAKASVTAFGNSLAKMTSLQ